MLSRILTVSMELTALRPIPRWDPLIAAERRALAALRPTISARINLSAPVNKTSTVVTLSHSSKISSAKRRSTAPADASEVKRLKNESSDEIIGRNSSSRAPVLLKPSSGPLCNGTADFMSLLDNPNSSNDGEDGEFSAGSHEQGEDVGDDVMASHLTLNLVSDSDSEQAKSYQ